MTDNIIDKKAELTDSSIKKAVSIRLGYALDNSALSGTGRATALAEKLGVTKGAVSKWLKGDSLPSPSNIYRISKLLNVSKEWLMFGAGNVKLAHAPRQYPLLTTAQAGAWTGSGYLANIGEKFEMINSNTQASCDSFYIEIKGDSMLTKFKQGDLVLIDPNLQPFAGKFVFAINDEGETVFKQYKELAERTDNGSQHFELNSLNTLYPTLSTKFSNIRIVGVAVEHIEKI